MFLTNALLIDGKKKPFSSYLSHSSSVQNTVGAVYSVAPPFCETSDLGC